MIAGRVRNERATWLRRGWVDWTGTRHRSPCGGGICGVAARTNRPLSSVRLRAAAHPAAAGCVASDPRKDAASILGVAPPARNLTSLTASSPPAGAFECWASSTMPPAAICAPWWIMRSPAIASTNLAPGRDRPGVNRSALSSNAVPGWPGEQTIACHDIAPGRFMQDGKVERLDRRLCGALHNETLRCWPR